MIDTLEAVPCNLCGATDVSTILDVGARGRVVRCRCCGLGYVSPRPASTLHLYEDEGYFGGDPPGGGGHGYDSYESDLRALEPYFERLAREIAGIRPGGALLEIGCAAGSFLARAREQGFAVSGVEPSPSARRLAEATLGVTVLAPTVEQAEVPPQSFDVVVLLQTIEHLADPKATLSRIRQLLRPGGLLLLTTPNRSSWLSRLTGRRWFEYKPPEHLYYFTGATMRRMLAASGFSQTVVSRDVHRYPPGFVLGRLRRYAPRSAPIVGAVERLLPQALREFVLPVYYGSMKVRAFRDR